MSDAWQLIKEELKKSLSKGQYDLWVSTIDFQDFSEGCLQLGCRNRFHVEWLREKLEEELYRICRKYLPELSRICYQVVSESAVNDSQEEEAEWCEAPRQIHIHDLIRRVGPVFNPRFTFDHFVVGQCNQFAYAASMGLASGQPLFSQSVYILSDTGLGKSHLSHAVGNHLLAQKSDLKIRYTTTEQFANEMIFAIKNDKLEAFKNKFRTDCDVLLLEKIEFLSGKEKIQSELVYTLDELLDRGKKILCTGSAYPRDIPRLNSELKSRLGGLLLAPIERPDFKTRVEIVKRKSLMENVRLPDEVAEFLAERITSDIRQLESCLVALIVKTNLMNVPVGLDIAKEVTERMIDRLPKITIDQVQKVVCQSYNISPEDLRSPSRLKKIATARKIAMYLCRQYTTESLSTIGKSFERSHSSVLYAVKGLSKEMKDKSSQLRRQVNYLSRRLETSCLTE